MKTKFIQTRITEDLFKKLKDRADEEERSVSNLMRVVIKDYLINVSKK